MVGQEVPGYAGGVYGVRANGYPGLCTVYGLGV